MKTALQQTRTLVKELNSEGFDGFYVQVGQGSDSNSRCTKARIHKGKLEVYALEFSEWVTPIGDTILINRTNDTWSIPTL